MDTPVDTARPRQYWGGPTISTQEKSWDTPSGAPGVGPTSVSQAERAGPGCILSGGPTLQKGGRVKPGRETGPLWGKSPYALTGHGASLTTAEGDRDSCQHQRSLEETQGRGKEEGKHTEKSKEAREQKESEKRADEWQKKSRQKAKPRKTRETGRREEKKEAREKAVHQEEESGGNLGDEQEGAINDENALIVIEVDEGVLQPEAKGEEVSKSSGPGVPAEPGEDLSGKSVQNHSGDLAGRKPEFVGIVRVGGLEGGGASILRPPQVQKPPEPGTLDDIEGGLEKAWAFEIEGGRDEGRASILRPPRPKSPKSEDLGEAEVRTGDSEYVQPGYIMHRLAGEGDQAKNKAKARWGKKNKGWKAWLYSVVLVVAAIMGGAEAAVGEQMWTSRVDSEGREGEDHPGLAAAHDQTEGSGQAAGQDARGSGAAASNGPALKAEPQGGKGIRRRIRVKTKDPCGRITGRKRIRSKTSGRSLREQGREDYEESKTDGESTPQDKEIITIMSNNITSWKKRGEAMMAEKTDVLAMQEVRLSPIGIRRARERMAKKGWNMVAGRGQGYQKTPKSGGVGAQRYQARTVRAGGVAVAASNGRTLLKSGKAGGPAKMLDQTGRWTRAAMPVGDVRRGRDARTFLHIASLHNNPGYSKAERTQNERDLRWAIEDGNRLGRQAVVLCMDANTRVSESEAIQTAIQSGTRRWYDAAQLFQGSDGPEPTYGHMKGWDRVTREGATRPDIILLNEEAKAACKGFRVRRDLPTRQHLGLEVDIEVGKLTERTVRLVRPKEYKVWKAGKMKEEEKRELLLQASMRTGIDATVVQAQDKVEERWAKFGELCEAYMEERVRGLPNESRGTKGRSREPSKIYERKVARVMRTSHEEEESKRLVALEKMRSEMARMREAKAKEGNWKVEGKKLLATTQDLWDKVRRKGKALLADLKDKWWRKATLEMQEGMELEEEMDDIIEKEAKEVERTRSRKVKKIMQEDWKRGGERAYKSIRDEEVAVIDAVRNEQGQVTTDPEEIAKEVSRTWGKLYNREEKVNVEEFMDKYGGYIPTVECKLPRLEGRMFKERFMKMKAKRAVAADGWRIRELRDLPEDLLEIGAQLVQEVEEGGRWPRVNTIGIVTTLKKGSGQGEAGTKDDEVVAADGSETRPITNTSPWVAAYETIRYDDMEHAREAIMTEDMHGARRGKEVYGVSLDLALHLEEKELDNETVAGVTIDKKKFFDLLDYGLVMAIWRRMGIPEAYVRATENFYEDLVTMYKVGGSLSDESKRANGFIQGLSGSIQAALTIMSVWDRMIKHQCPHVETGGFIDDTNMRASGSEAVSHLMKAWGLTKDFDKAAGMVINKGKTKVYATNQQAQKEVRAELKKRGDSEVVTTMEFTLVGSCIRVGRQGSGEERRKRVDKAIRTMDRVADCGMKMEQKMSMLGMAGMSKAVFGTELQPLNSTQKMKLRRKASAVIWKKSTWLRGPTPTMCLVAKGHRIDPRQAQTYYQMTVWRRMLSKSKKIRKRAETVWEKRRAKEIEMGKGTGPIAILEKTVVELGWDWQLEFGSFQRGGGKVDLPFLGQEDGWWTHELREDLRNNLWTNDRETTKRASFQGCQAGVDHAATADMYRARQGRTRKTSERGKEPIDTAGGGEEEEEEQDEDEGEGANERGHKLDEEERAILRSLWTGSFKSGKRLHGANIRPSPKCPHCRKGEDETVEHIFWRCSAWKEQRKTCQEKYGEEELEKLPTITRICGIKTATPGVEEQLKNVSSIEEDEPFPPRREEGQTDDEKYVGDMLVVASDGACPDQQGHPALRRAGQGLFYGDGHSYNCAWPTDTYSQGAQRAEVRAAARWVAWAWGPTVLWTDSSLVARGIRTMIQ